MKNEQSKHRELSELEKQVLEMRKTAKTLEDFQVINDLKEASRIKNAQRVLQEMMPEILESSRAQEILLHDIAFKTAHKEYHDARVQGKSAEELLSLNKRLHHAAELNEKVLKND
ncbi:hypothetical protein LNTAR_14987 [Lentisphaera araneosa HTCC2155]|uniref:Uncharacterized protein n=1 Tax=Lentisphaera araneosa HTCC2155 TaxID=313628 RepID=A6DHP9_9BACT|nr:hypothetical protein [Lentisphaera araneosa]EDM29132.1 hypothetical protein LNTAR_14987 [Lentisphaera araneosa HTCC2155]